MIEFVADRWLDIAVAFAAVSLVAVIGGLMTDIGPWYESLRFPWFRPPNWLFGPAWTVIFVLIAASGVIAWEQARDPAAKRALIGLFAINAALNIAWSPLFFKMRRPDWALYEVLFFWMSVVALMVTISRISAAAGWIIAPYLAWVTFAGFLNWRVVQLNKPFGPQP